MIGLVSRQGLRSAVEGFCTGFMVISTAIWWRAHRGRQVSRGVFLPCVLSYDITSDNMPRWERHTQRSGSAFFLLSSTQLMECLIGLETSESRTFESECLCNSGFRSSGNDLAVDVDKVRTEAAL